MTINGATHTFTQEQYQSAGPLVLGALNTSGAVSSFASESIYPAQLYNNGDLVLDLVPCTDPSGSVGMYDLVSNAFFPNAGTGVFASGPEVLPSQPDPSLDPYTWYENIDIPTQFEMAQYLANVQALADVLSTAQYSVQLPQSMALLTYVGANNIETILQEINVYINAISAVFLPAGAVWASAGSPGFYFISN